MDIQITHTKNPLLGWDITVTITSATEETLNHVKIEINGFPEYNSAVEPPANRWEKILTQQGVYPGDNKVVVTAINNRGEQTIAISEW